MAEQASSALHHVGNYLLRNLKSIGNRFRSPVGWNSASGMVLAQYPRRGLSAVFTSGRLGKRRSSLDKWRRSSELGSGGWKVRPLVRTIGGPEGSLYRVALFALRRQGWLICKNSPVDL